MLDAVLAILRCSGGVRLDCWGCGVFLTGAVLRALRSILSGTQRSGNAAWPMVRKDSMVGRFARSSCEGFHIDRSWKGQR